MEAGLPSMSKFGLAILLACSAARSFAQLPAPRPFVQASAQASVFAAPDQVTIDAVVVTRGATAQDAASSNAGQVASLVAALSKALGPGADIKTVNYFVGPVYQNPPGGGPGTIAGYTANLTSRVTLGSTALAGAVIDVMAQAGATTIGSPQFSLKDREPTHLQALRAATVQAKTHADAMAAGLGRTTGNVISIQEGAGPVAIPLINSVLPVSVAPTSIQPALIEVPASVIVVVELN